MTTTKTDVRVTRVTITRVEGPTELCDIPTHVDSIDAANRLLARWSHTAPKGGCYDKCDFVIEFEGTEHNYEGRYDLKHGSEELPDLRTQLDYFTGMAVGIRPKHITPELFERLVLSIDDEEREFLTAIRPAVLS